MADGLKKPNTGIQYAVESMSPEQRSYYERVAGHLVTNDLFSDAVARDVIDAIHNQHGEQLRDSVVRICAQEKERQTMRDLSDTEMRLSDDQHQRYLDEIRNIEDADLHADKTAQLKMAKAFLYYSGSELGREINNIRWEISQSAEGDIEEPIDERHTMKEAALEVTGDREPSEHDTTSIRHEERMAAREVTGLGWGE